MAKENHKKGDAMYEIAESHKGQGKDVVGHRFATVGEAEGFLAEHGWMPDKYNEGEYSKEGPVRMCGMLGVGIMHYVHIEKV